MTAIAVVLDTSALVAYAHGSVAVGELILIVAEEGRLVGVPAACLTAAGATIADDFGAAQLGRLISVEAVCVLPLGVDKALEVGEYAREANGDVATGHALYETLWHEAYYGTMQPKQAQNALPAGWTILDLNP